MNTAPYSLVVNGGMTYWGYNLLRLLCNLLVSVMVILFVFNYLYVQCIALSHKLQTKLSTLDE